MAGSQAKSAGAGAGIGAGIGAWLGGAQGAAAGGQIGASIGGAFGSDGRNRTKWNYRTAIDYDFVHRRNRLKQEVIGARRAGLHPLAALGIAPSGQSVSVPHAMPGQSQSGSAISDAIGSVARRFQDAQLEKANLENDLIREQIRASKVATTAQAANSGGAMGPDRLQVGDQVLYPDPARGSDLEIIGAHYGDEVADAVGIARYLTDWNRDRFQPSVKTLQKEFKNRSQAQRNRTAKKLRKAAKAIQQNQRSYATSRHFWPKDRRRTNPYR